MSGHTEAGGGLLGLIERLAHSRAAALESDCAHALMLQRYDMIDRLHVVNALGWNAPPPAVASSLYVETP